MTPISYRNIETGEVKQFFNEKVFDRFFDNNDPRKWVKI
jgi:hypothetical protein